ncbi:unnamed protein product, partial [Prorocentrum cordatum]
INLHPQYSQVLKSLHAVFCTKLVWSDFVGSAIAALAKSLGLKFSMYSDDTRGAHLERLYTTQKKAARALRAVARIRCLQQVRQTRLDIEQVDNVGVDASFDRVFTKWYSALDDRDRKLLTICHN